MSWWVVILFLNRELREWASGCDESFGYGLAEGAGLQPSLSRVLRTRLRLSQFLTKLLSPKGQFHFVPQSEAYCALHPLEKFTFHRRASWARPFLFGLVDDGSGHP